MVTFWRELLIRFTVCSLCILTYCNLFISHFVFEGGTLVLIASVTGHCLSFSFENIIKFVCAKVSRHTMGFSTVFSTVFKSFASINQYMI